jgi:hypothetical protein
LQRIASITEGLSIEVNVTQEHLKSGTFEINAEERDIAVYEKTGRSRKYRDEW